MEEEDTSYMDAPLPFDTTKEGTKDDAVAPENPSVDICSTRDLCEQPPAAYEKPASGVPIIPKGLNIAPPAPDAANEPAGHFVDAGSIENVWNQQETMESAREAFEERRDQQYVGRYIRRFITLACFTFLGCAGFIGANIIRDVQAYKKDLTAFMTSPNILAEEDTKPYINAEKGFALVYPGWWRAKEFVGLTKIVDESVEGEFFQPELVVRHTRLSDDDMKSSMQYAQALVDNYKRGILYSPHIASLDPDGQKVLVGYVQPLNGTMNWYHPQYEYRFDFFSVHSGIMTHAKISLPVEHLQEYKAQYGTLLQSIETF